MLVGDRSSEDDRRRGPREPMHAQRLRSMMMCLVLLLCSCDERHASTIGSDDLATDTYKREVTVTEVTGRQDYYVGDRLVESIWLVSGRPSMRTVWQPNGYGHLFGFSESGALLWVSEARFGTKHGVEMQLDPRGYIVKTTRFHDGRETEPAETGDSSDAPPEGLDVEEYQGLTDSDEVYVQLREYSSEGQIRESRWYLPNGDLAMRSRWGGDGYGHAFFFSRFDGSLEFVTEGRFGVANGLALRFTEDGEQVREVYIVGGPFAPEDDPD